MHDTLPAARRDLLEIADWTSQLRRGVLELCILRLLDRDATYGYELVTTLGSFGPKLGSQLQRATALARQTDDACAANDVKTASRRMKQAQKFLRLHGELAAAAPPELPADGALPKSLSKAKEAIAAGDSARAFSFLQQQQKQLAALPPEKRDAESGLTSYFAAAAVVTGLPVPPGLDAGRLWRAGDGHPAASARRRRAARRAPARPAPRAPRRSRTPGTRGAVGGDCGTGGTG